MDTPNIGHLLKHADARDGFPPNVTYQRYYFMTPHGDAYQANKGKREKEEKLTGGKWQTVWMTEGGVVILFFIFITLERV